MVRTYTLLIRLCPQLTSTYVLPLVIPAHARSVPLVADVCRTSNVLILQVSGTYILLL